MVYILKWLEVRSRSRKAPVSNESLHVHSDASLRSTKLAQIMPYTKYGI